MKYGHRLCFGYSTCFFTIIQRCIIIIIIIISNTKLWKWFHKCAWTVASILLEYLTKKLPFQFNNFITINGNFLKFSHLNLSCRYETEALTSKCSHTLISVIYFSIVFHAFHSIPFTWTFFLHVPYSIFSFYAFVCMCLSLHIIVCTTKHSLHFDAKE